MVECSSKVLKTKDTDPVHPRDSASKAKRPSIQVARSGLRGKHIPQRFYPALGKSCGPQVEVLGPSRDSQQAPSQ